ncbi:adenosylcobinamide amidohydrolase [uncultured Methanobrevibacter sp.]|uniref:adenosylcobinamide amidohydrolase n=1 Tax=uncultured Methanobrevibacter sp. TaxID=253161 RepID=UPI0025D494AF|nr:adenosylcobinamide amidohydrolase [uncultured Methanobrevibacter sp.]
MITEDKKEEFKLISKTINQDEIYLNHDSIVVKFQTKKNGIVTSWLNGGYREDLTAVFNHQLSQENIDKYYNGGILKFLEKLSKDYFKQLNLNNENLSGMVTSADINKYSIAIESYDKIEVVAITTAGVRVNQVSAGDEASYYEINGEYNLYSDLNTKINPKKPGTINTIILINAKLDESSLLLAEMIAVEAKTVALRDLMTSSNYSNNIATGTGTDGIAIFSNLDSENFIENMSKHAKIGELIGKAVIKSIKNSLAKLQWLTPTYQLNALIRLNRYQMNLEPFYNEYISVKSQKEKEEFIISLVKISKNPELVGYVSLIIHIIDQYRLGLLSKKASLNVSKSILNTYFNRKDWYSMKLLLKYVIDNQIQ